MKNMKKVGIFEIRPDLDSSELKWILHNTLTGYVHKTYGKWAEVKEIAEQQSKAWQARLQAKGYLMPKLPKTRVAKKSSDQAKVKRVGSAEKTRSRRSAY